MSPELALFEHGAMSDLSPEGGLKPTSMGMLVSPLGVDAPHASRLMTPVGVAKLSMVRMRFSSHQPYSAGQFSNLRLRPRSCAQWWAMFGLNWDCRPTAMRSALPFANIASGCWAL